ncbi:MAG: ATPase domain-containing protein [Syntrophomonadaceae bacterium]|nr:ATPase domain-containing protein [Syntrophomonadaceae bacterium]
MATSKMAFFGIYGIDNLIGEGLSYGSQVMIRGNSGMGKSVLASQFVKETLTCRDNCIYVCCDESPRETRQYLKQYGLHPLPYEEKGRLVFVDAYSLEPTGSNYFSSEDGLEKYLALEKQVIESMKNGKPTRIIVDSLSTLLMGRDTQEIMEFHRYRLKFLKKAGIIAMDLMVDEVLEESMFKLSAHLYDVIIRMYYTGSPERPMRALHMGKMKSGKFDSSQLFYTINPNIGLVIMQNLAD